MRKLEKMAKELLEFYREDMSAEMKKRFEIKVETMYDIFVGRLVTTRADNKDFTVEQMAFMKGFEEGYLSAYHHVVDADKR